MTMSPSELTTGEPAATTAPTSETTDGSVEGKSLSKIAWTRLRRDKVAMFSALCILLIVLMAVFAPLITRLVGVDPETFYSDAIDVNAGGLPKGNLGGISLEHPLGVEPSTGRDVFARLLYGARVSLMIGLLATAVSVILGTILGAAAGFFRGWVDGVISRLMDLLLAFPQLLMLIALTPVITARMEAFGMPGGNVSRVSYLILFIGFFGWPYFGRIIRGQVLSLREREFVDAARSLGAGGGHIIFKQLLPNLWASVLVFATLIIPTYIGTEAALSYLGVGVIPPTPTWGNMLQDSVNYSYADPAYLFIPGTALFLVVLFFNLFGDGLRDALDPKSGR